MPRKIYSTVLGVGAKLISNRESLTIDIPPWPENGRVVHFLGAEEPSRRVNERKRATRDRVNWCICQEGRVHKGVSVGVSSGGGGWSGSKGCGVSDISCTW